MIPQWKNFKGGDWCTKIDVRDFIIKNYTPYEGDEQFLKKPEQMCERVQTNVHLPEYTRDHRRETEKLRSENL